jgi:hypothetical protein
MMAENNDNLQLAMGGLGGKLAKQVLKRPPVDSALGKKAEEEAAKLAAQDAAKPAGGLADIAGQMEGRETALPAQDMVDRINNPQVNPDHMEGRLGEQRNVNLDHFNDDKTKEVIELYNREADGYQDNPKRRVVTHKETIERSQSARTLGNVIGGKPPEHWDQADLVRAYTLMDEFDTELRESAARIGKKEESGDVISDEEYAEFEVLSTRFNALQYTVAGRAAEVGRMLNALQAVSKATKGGEHYKSTAAFLEAAGGKMSVAERVRIVNDSKNLAQTAAGLRVGWMDKATRAISKWRYNMMLSSFRTHVANVSGSTMAGTFEKVMVTPIKYTYNQAEFWARRGASKATGKDLNMSPGERMAFGELYSMQGYKDGVRAGLVEAAKALRGESTSRNKIANEMGAIKRTEAATGVRAKAGKVGETLGAVGSMPTRALVAEDEVFYATYYNGRMRELAIRRATAEGGSMKEIDERISILVQSPTDDMITSSRLYAEKLTYTGDPSTYGKLLGGLANIAASAKQKSRAIELIIPFVRTPANILGYTSEATGLNLLMAPGKTLHALTKGAPEERAEAMAKFTTAAGLFYLTENLFEDGTVTGAPPKNYNLLRAREAAGWRPGSLRLGDEYYQLNRADPMGLALEMMATYHDLVNNEYYDPNDPKHTAAALGVFMSLTDMMGDRSFLSGLGETLSAIENASPRMLANVGARIITSYITPGIARDVREFSDPYRREMATTEGFIDPLIERTIKSAMNALPGLSQQLPPSTDVHGDDITNHGTGYWRAMVPVRLGKIKTDDVARAYISNNVPISKPANKIKLRGHPDINLLAIDDGAGWIYREYQRRVGKHRKSMVKQMIDTSQYQELQDNGDVGEGSMSQELIRRVSRRATSLATFEMVQWLDGRTEFMPKIDKENALEAPIQLTHVLNAEQYTALAVELRTMGAEARAKFSFDDPELHEFIKIKPHRGVKGMPPELSSIPKF